MNVLIVGLGSVGRRHLANLRQVEPTAQITIWHQRTKASDRTTFDPSIDASAYRLEEALESKPEVALITCPASLHVETGLVLARQGIHLLIEKPLSHTVDGVDELLRLCRERSLVLMVGYNLRFYRPLQIMRQAVTDGRIGRVLALRAEVGQYLPDWRPDRDYRQSVSAKSALGGGAVLELSHELDYMRWLGGEVEAVTAQMDHLSGLDIDVEDTAEIILRFSNSAIGSVHVDMIQRTPTRMCRIVGSEGTLTWDWADHRVRCFSAKGGEWTDLWVEERHDRNTMYIEELRHFLTCVKDHQCPAVSGEDGLRALQIALAAKESAQTGRLVTV